MANYKLGKVVIDWNQSCEQNFFGINSLKIRAQNFVIRFHIWDPIHVELISNSKTLETRVLFPDTPLI